MPKIKATSSWGGFFLFFKFPSGNIKVSGRLRVMVMYKYFGVLVLLLGSLHVEAATFEEKESLSLVASELQMMIQDIKVISKQYSLDSDAEPINYEALLGDIEKVKGGIERRVNEYSHQPKNMEPITGVY
ncbi:RAQPRD family integrative conjugative element protein [Vibrio rotiferianus]|uniref:RAQPRD family integrative conjugative element protein n=1 Tax=Vibrio rotiferianus TaxID=190895 RepID=UPI0005EFF2AB|nr:RAQPRD family integrative conjugative element protein [Vibrio rotiferianus]